MKVCKVYGTCNNCGRFAHAIGADPEDALLLLHHYHNPDCKERRFEGETTHKYIDDREIERDT